MKDPIFIVSRVTKRCPFSKTLIYPKTMLCVFNKHQYNSFVIQISELLSNRLPIDLIEKIIELTNYKKLLDRTGLEKFTNWKLDYYLSSLSVRELKERKRLLLLYETSEDESDSAESDEED